MTRGVKTPNAHDVRNEYVTSPNHVPIEKLALKHDIPYQTLKEICAREKWVEQRDEFQQKAAQESYSKQLKEEIKRRAELLEKGKLLQTKIIDSLLAQKSTCPHCHESLPYNADLAVGDLDKICRLLGFTAGDVDSRPAGGITESDAQKWLKEKRAEIAKIRGETDNQKVSVNMEESVPQEEMSLVVNIDMGNQT